MNSYSYNLDSVYHHTVSLGSHTSYFTKEILYNFSANQRFYVNGPRRGIGIGYDYFKKLTDKKSWGGAFFASHSICSYSYSNLSKSPLMHDGKIDFTILSLSPQFKYYIFKWVNLRLGLPISYLAQDKFDNVEVAKNIEWYNMQGKSNFSRIYLSYIVDLDFNIRKRFGLSISFINGITKLGTLRANEFGKDYTFDEKLVSGYITLNYKFK